MKKAVILFIFTLIHPVVIFSQIPHLFNYQAIIRDDSGDLLVNRAVSFKMSILSGTDTGDIVYEETHNVSTNSTALGYYARVSASNTVRMGNTSVTQIGGQVAWSNLSDGRFKANVKENVLKRISV